MIRAQGCGVALALALFVGSAASCRAQAPDSTALRSFGVADFSWRLLTLGGERLTLAAFRGRVIVINSWATWCEPCVAELRSLTALRNAVPDTGVVFVLIAPQQREPVRQFVTRRGLALPVYLETSRPPSVFRFEAVPTTWIIDRRGAIVFRHRGAARWDLPNTIAFLNFLRAQ